MDALEYLGNANCRAARARHVLTVHRFDAGRRLGHA